MQHDGTPKQTNVPARARLRTRLLRARPAAAGAGRRGEDPLRQVALHARGAARGDHGAGKMQRVFDNLLRNAVNYSFDDSTIHITVKQNGENLCIQFTNCGNTIPKEKLVRIFEQFYRLDVARSSRSGGAGLGLAVANEIVELHNGTITAKSENEQIEFTVTLPLL